MRQALLFFIFISTLSVHATPFHYGRTVTISKPVFEDLYITAGTVTINAPVYGDLVIAGGTVNINDSVTQDVLVVGGKVTLNGYVGDDMRCAGGEIIILGNVAGDVVVTGGRLFIGHKSTVTNFIASSGDLVINGTIIGNLTSASGNLVLNGSVLKNAECRGGKIIINGQIGRGAILASNDMIVVGDEATFGDNVRYFTPGRKPDFKSSIRAGEATFDRSLDFPGERWYYLGFSSFMGLVWYCGMALLLIVILQYLFGPVFKKAGNTVYKSPGRSLGYGVLFLIGMPIAAVLTFVTLIGVPVGIILIFSYVIMVALATVITSVVAANWLQNRSRSHWTFWQMVFTGFGMFVVIKIVSYTPFLGWLILGTLVCASFGSILLNINWRRRMLTAGPNKSTLTIQ